MGPFFCRASERVKHIRQGLIGTVTWKNLSARPRDRHSPAHLKGASNEPARGAAMTSGPRSPTVCYGALDPPVGGTFHFENLGNAAGNVHRSRHALNADTIRENGRWN